MEENQHNQSKNNTDPDLKNITEQLYKQNLDLAARNKTLSLLRELYQISISTLEPKNLASKISSLILNTLEFETVVLYSFLDKDRTLQPLGVSISDKIQSVAADKNLSLEISPLGDLANDDSFKFLLEPVAKIIEDIVKIWPNLSPEQYQILKTDGHIRTSLVYPLVIEAKLIGALFIMINRPYIELNQFEKDSIVNIVNVIAVALDRSILDQQLKEANDKLKELDKQKTEFVSIASHQLRSPLTAIKGYSSLILEGSFGPISDKVKEAVDVVFQSSQKLVLVIEDFLDITRIELGKMKYEMNKVDLQEIVGQVVNELRHSVESHDLELQYETAGAKYWILGDKGKISQVVGNMIDNAMKYTKAGTISVSVSGDKDSVRLKVKDTGVGISPDTITKLFQKFARAKGASKVNITGTGLGLFVAKQIVDAHKGKIWAESEGIGKGSTFIVEFPAQIG